MDSQFDRVKDRFRSILPGGRTDRFIARLTEQSALAVEGAEALVSYMRKPGKRTAQTVRDIEKRADEERRMLIDELNRTFVTPIDREDISLLSRALDDVLDYMYSVVSEMDILSVGTNDILLEMAQLLHDASVELHMAMQRLQRHPKVAEDHAVRAKQIDNRMEALYTRALADLFQTPEDLNQVVRMLKLREIYRHMLHAIGSSDTAANIISDIVVKFF
jgi:uncharacterized protein Yka (UPF0111/DUF47 family)